MNGEDKILKSCPSCGTDYKFSSDRNTWVHCDNAGCPSRKKREVTTPELGTLAICSVRYALGRQTYIVDDVCQIVTKNWGGISESVKKTIKRDVRSEIARGMISEVDMPDWSKLLEL